MDIDIYIYIYIFVFNIYIYVYIWRRVKNPIQGSYWKHKSYGVGKIGFWHSQKTCTATGNSQHGQPPGSQSTGSQLTGSSGRLGSAWLALAPSVLDLFARWRLRIGSCKIKCDRLGLRFRGSRKSKKNLTLQLGVFIKDLFGRSYFWGVTQKNAFYRRGAHVNFAGHCRGRGWASRAGVIRGRCEDGVLKVFVSRRWNDSFGGAPQKRPFRVDETMVFLKLV